MPTGKYYNTTRLERTEKYQRLNLKQEEIVLQVFQQSELALSAWDVLSLYPIQHVPITSIRRACNSLEREGKLERTGDKKMSVYNRPEFIYKLKNQ